MNKNNVYIMTRSRRENLKKIIPRWLNQDFKVNLVVEPKEFNDTEKFVDENFYSYSLSVIPLPEEERGIGYARSCAVNHAYLRGLKSIVMSDDDIRPCTSLGNAEPLIQEASKYGVLGVGATQRIHDHFTKGAISRLSGVILCPGGWGMQLFGLNVNKTIALGNFDDQLDCFGEDHELVRQGILAGIPWLVHCGVKCEPLGSRFSPGGINSFIESKYPRTSDAVLYRAAREARCRRIIHDRWPKYTSSQQARSRVAWQKMLDDYIPDWRSRSAIHGGHL